MSPRAWMQTTDLWLPLENHDAATLVPSGEEVSGIVEFNRRDDVGCQETDLIQQGRTLPEP